MPYSAHFYSRGRAEDLPKTCPVKIRAALRDNGLDYFAIRYTRLDSLPAEVLLRTREVGRFGNYILRVEKPRLD
jgi:hypothetical protein